MPFVLLSCACARAGRPKISDLAATINRTVHDLEVWGKRREARLARAQKEKRVAEEQANSVYTFKPAINEKSRK